MRLVEQPVVPLQRLQVFGDSICVRDPRGRSRRPSLERASWNCPSGPGAASGPALRVCGSFSVIQRFTITPEEGRAFVEASGDANPIHTEGTVVSGAMTAARFLLLPEILVPHLAVTSLRVKFRAFSHYGLPTIHRYTFRLNSSDDAGDFAQIDLASFQGGALVAEGVLKTARALPGRAPLPCRPGVAADSVRTWLRSLKLSPDLALEAIGDGFAGPFYPRAFLASLPSGEMVRQGGAGGLLNILDLEFPELGSPPLELASPPTVHLEPGRPRSAFRRVLTRVASGMVTYCKGYATVLLDLLRGGGDALAAPDSPPAPVPI